MAARSFASLPLVLCWSSAASAWSSALRRSSRRLPLVSTPAPMVRSATRLASSRCPSASVCHPRQLVVVVLLLLLGTTPFATPCGACPDPDLLPINPNESLSCAGPRETVCVKDVKSLAFLALARCAARANPNPNPNPSCSHIAPALHSPNSNQARCSAYFDYPLYMLLFLSKVRVRSG